MNKTTNLKKELLQIKKQIIKNTFKLNSFALLLTASLNENTLAMNLSINTEKSNKEYGIIYEKSNSEIDNLDNLIKKINSESINYREKKLKEIITTLQDKIKEEIVQYETEELENIKLILNSQDEDRLLSQKEIPMEEKIDYILEKYNLTEEQLLITICTILAEAKHHDINNPSEEDYIECYIDAYATTTTIYNRTKSSCWVNECNRIMGEGTGTNIYYQTTLNGQFEGYLGNYYQDFLNTDLLQEPGYYAIIDCLYTEDIMHNYLCFRSYTSDEEGKIQFVNKGNRYFSELKVEDLIIEQNTNLQLTLKN